jgi:2-polyprenyl-3-methyl-5-hydroxy-6-metoxy-1,4-benzoquinol methylase
MIEMGGDSLCESFNIDVCREDESCAASQHYAADYSADHSTIGRFFRVRQSIVLGILSERSGGGLLDVGCGPGIYSEPSIALGYQYHGLDASQGMIHERMRRSKAFIICATRKDGLS